MERQIFHPTRLHKALALRRQRWRATKAPQRQSPKWRSSLISQRKKRQVSQHSSCLACIFGISSHRYSWIILRKLHPQIKVGCLLDLFILVRSCWAGACRLITCLKNLVWGSRARKVGQKVGLFPPLNICCFLEAVSSVSHLPHTPQLWLEVTTMGHVDGHSETERTGKCLRHKTLKLVSSNTENKGLRPDFWCLELSGSQKGWACRGWQR